MSKYVVSLINKIDDAITISPVIIESQRWPQSQRVKQ